MSSTIAMLRCLAVAAALSTFVVGCGKTAPTIDATSEEAFKQSLMEVTASLPPEERERFQKASTEILMSSFDFQRLFTGADPELMASEGMAKMSGLTASEVLELHASMEREFAEAERAALAQEVTDLKLKIAETKVQIAQLQLPSTIEVEQVTFSWQTSSFLSQPAISIRLKNVGDVAVSRAYFDAKVFTPGRSVPWVETTFNFEVSGGIEPGETYSTTLDAGYTGGWRSIPKDRDDVLMEAQPYRADGPDGEALFDIKQRTELMAQLASLEADLDDKQRAL